MSARPPSRAHASGLDEVIMLVVGTALALAVTLLTVRGGGGGRKAGRRRTWAAGSGCSVDC